MKFWLAARKDEELDAEIRNHLDEAIAIASNAANRLTKRAPMPCANSAMWAWSRRSRARCGAGLRSNA